jgi:hypothetical protein
VSRNLISKYTILYATISLHSWYTNARCTVTASSVQDICLDLIARIISAEDQIHETFIRWKKIFRNRCKHSFQSYFVRENIEWFCVVPRNEGTCQGQSRVLCLLTLDTAYRPGHLLPKWNTPYSLSRDWAGSRAGPDFVEKRRISRCCRQQNYSFCSQSQR